VNFTAENLEQVAGALADKGVYALSIREVDGGADIEIRDPIHTVESLAELLGFSEETIRNMERLGILHAIKSRGIGGSLRFRQSRVYADLRRAEEMKRR
jgi:hypothetical protein